MSFCSLMRDIFGRPIEFKVMRLKKKGQYLFKINSDNPEVIEEFKRHFDKAKRLGEDIYIPIDVEVEELRRIKK